MDFEFDPAKAAGNLRKHGVSFADAEGVFARRVDPPDLRSSRHSR
jgi:uncharacterized DUF497 family protein